MYTRLCVAETDFGMRAATEARSCKPGIKRTVVPHRIDTAYCWACHGLPMHTGSDRATSFMSRFEHVRAEHRRINRHFCCDRYCSAWSNERYFSNSKRHKRWLRFTSDPKRFAAEADALLHNAAQYNRVPRNRYRRVDMGEVAKHCTVCCREYTACVCFCQRVILPGAMMMNGVLTSTEHNPRVRGGLLAGNVLARMYTFWDSPFAYYQPRFMLHLARLGFVETERKCIRCTECLFLVSFWDVFCLFHYSGIARTVANADWHERILKMLYSKEARAKLITRCSARQRREELVDGLDMLNVWHAQLHPACSNIAHTERYARVVLRRALVVPNIAASPRHPALRVYGTKASRAVASVPHLLASRKLGYA